MEIFNLRRNIMDTREGMNSAVSRQQSLITERLAAELTQQRQAREARFTQYISYLEIGVPDTAQAVEEFGNLQTEFFIPRTAQEETIITNAGGYVYGF
jgi:hypothetical protein